MQAPKKRQHPTKTMREFVDDYSMREKQRASFLGSTGNTGTPGTPGTPGNVVSFEELTQQIKTAKKEVVKNQIVDAHQKRGNFTIPEQI